MCVAGEFQKLLIVGIGAASAVLVAVAIADTVE